MSINIDSVTGLPDLTSDVYQIPLNTDALPYNDLQAESRLPHQPLLPDDIIPTIAVLTALRSDNTGEVVHTDDNHAAKVYVVNQPVSSTGGGTAAPGVGAARIHARSSISNTADIGGFFHMEPSLGPIERYFYGYSIALAFTSTIEYTNQSPFLFELKDANAVFFRFHVCFPRQPDGSGAPKPFYNFSTWLPRPVDLTTNGMDVTTDCYINALLIPMSYAVVIYTSDDP